MGSIPPWVASIPPWLAGRDFAGSQEKTGKRPFNSPLLQEFGMESNHAVLEYYLWGLTMIVVILDLRCCKYAAP